MMSRAENLKLVQPLSYTKQEAIRYIGSVALVKRMLHATRHGNPWVEIVSNFDGIPGRDVLIDVKSLDAAHQRLRAGEQPPLLPSEILYRKLREEKLGRLPKLEEPDI